MKRTTVALSLLASGAGVLAVWLLLRKRKALAQALSLTPELPSWTSWDQIDPSGQGRQDPLIRQRLQAAAWKTDEFRQYLGVPALQVSPHGGFEPPGGFPDGYRRSSETTQHKQGTALDVYTPDGMSRSAFHSAAAAFHAIAGGGLGYYDWGVHIDNGPTRTWDERSKAVA